MTEFVRHLFGNLFGVAVSFGQLQVISHARPITCNLGYFQHSSDNMAGIVLTSVIVFVVHFKVVSGENRTSRIYNPIVQLVNFPNDACIGSATRLPKLILKTF